jgi:hypothetical protein
LNVVDLTGEKNQSSVTIGVTPPLVITSFYGNATSVIAGHSVKFTNTTSGGTGSNAYSYSLSSSAGVTQNSNLFTFGNTGNYTVTLTVTDSIGETATASAQVTATPAQNPGCKSNNGPVTSITASGKTQTLTITNQSGVTLTGSSNKLTIFMPGSNCNIALKITGSSDQVTVYNGTVALTLTGSSDTVVMHNTVVTKQTITGSSDKVTGAIINGNSFTITGSSNLIESVLIQKLNSLTLTGSYLNLTMTMLTDSPMAITIVGSTDIIRVINGIISLSITGSLDTFYYHNTTITGQKITGSGDKVTKN